MKVKQQSSEILQAKMQKTQKSDLCLKKLSEIQS
jgi:hypothetical protein